MLWFCSLQAGSVEWGCDRLIIRMLLRLIINPTGGQSIAIKMTVAGPAPAGVS